jgi:hypothetical protein
MKTSAAIRTFDAQRDVFAFANETVWNYQSGEVKWEQGDPRKPGGMHYTRRCFVLARSAAQFWNFARFSPAEPPASTAELARRIRAVVARPLWHRHRDEAKITIPGFPDLWAASEAEPKVFQDSLGGWRQSYFRWGNWRIVLPLGKRSQARAVGQLRHHLTVNGPTVLWLVNFPSLTINHAVLAVREHGSQANQFEVYDPNLPNEYLRLTFDNVTGRFHYPKTFYFSSGTVGVRLAYHKPWH